MNQSNDNRSLLGNNQKSVFLILLTFMLFLGFDVSASPLAFENTLAAQLAQKSQQSNTVSLSVSPEQCVAMQQGQNCYVAVELTWHADKTDNYCLYHARQSQPLQCWHNKREGTFKKEFTTKTNLHFAIKTQHGTKNFAQANVKMAWVHKKKGKPRKSWRLF